MQHRTVILALLALVGCGASSTAAERSEPAASPSASSSNNAGASSGAEAPTAGSAGPQGGAGDGTTFERPLETCGASESYQRVANFVCPEGDTPLHGDMGLGARARLGSSSAHMEGASIMESHIVDIYQVPCASGAREVFVCLYHCAPGASPYD